MSTSTHRLFVIQLSCLLILIVLALIIILIGITKKCECPLPAPNPLVSYPLAETLRWEKSLRVPKYWIWASLDGSSRVPLTFMLEITKYIPCESQWKYEAQGDDGCSHGPMQVNLCVHETKMKQLGFDPQSESDRVTFAGNVLYERWGEDQPFLDWSCSH